MKEIKNILLAFDEAQKHGKQTALATVVHVEGSSYRRPGARMLITEDGRLTGAISGGCLEGDALRKAMLVMEQQKPMLVKYDTMDDDDAKMGVGLGCNGIIHILIEPVDTTIPNNPIALLKTIVQQRQNAVIVTLFSLEQRLAFQPGTCLLLTANSVTEGDVGDRELKNKLVNDEKTALEHQASSVNHYTEGGNRFTAFIEYVAPAVSMVIVGAGNDVVPLAEMAAIIGWEVNIFDGRTNYATGERFPSAQKVSVAKPAQVIPQITIGAQTVFLLMTHNYNYDLAVLQQLAGRSVSYIGVLGPKKKLDRMLAELEEKGIVLPEGLLKRLHGPVGLDIGAETPAEIALSIIAEIKAVLAGKDGKPLKEKMEMIHPR